MHKHLYYYKFHLFFNESESLPVMSNSLQPHGPCRPWNSPGQNPGVGSCSLLQGIFPTRDWTQVSRTAGSFFTSWATREAQGYWSGEPIPSPADLPKPRNQASVSCIAGGFFTNWWWLILIVDNETTSPQRLNQSSLHSHCWYLVNAIHLILTDGIQSWEKLGYFWPASCILFITILILRDILAHRTWSQVLTAAPFSLIFLQQSHSSSSIIISHFSLTWNSTAGLLNTFF